MVPSYNDCLEGTSTSCRTGYKEGATDYPSPGCSRLGNYHARAPSIWGLRARRHRQYPPPRCSVRAGLPSRRQSRA